MTALAARLAPHFSLAKGGTLPPRVPSRKRAVRKPLGYLILRWAFRNSASA